MINVVDLFSPLFYLNVDLDIVLFISKTTSDSIDLLILVVNSI